MKFSCEKLLLQNAVNTASRAVAAKSSIPALEGLLLTCGGESLTVSGYNTQTGIRTKFTAEVEESGIVCEQVHRIGEGEETAEIQSEFGIISFADCFQEDGTASMRMFDSEESNVDPINTLREQPEYDVNTPAVLKGDAWAVDCTSVELCEQWAEHFDGEVLVAPDF